MSSEWATAIGTIGTFVVITASAIAALMQIRHMRSGNAISLLTAYNNEFDTAEFTAAFGFVRTKLSEYIFSAEEMQALTVGNYSDPLRAARTIGNFFEDMGSLVLTGLLHEKIVCNLYAQNVLDAWQAIAPIAFLCRKYRNAPGLWENFEYLAVLSQDFVAAHPNGIYPKRLRRMPADDSLSLRYEGSRRSDSIPRQ